MLGLRYSNDDIPEWELNAVQKNHRRIFLDKINSGVYQTERVSSCLCGGKELDSIAEKDRLGLPFGNVICKKCGLLLCSPRLAEKSLPLFYDADYHGLVFGSDKVNEFEFMVKKDQGTRIYNFLSKHLVKGKHYSVVELGAGVGNNLREMRDEAEKGGITIEVTGCEYSKACIDFAYDKYGLELVQGGTEVIVQSGEKHDIVIMSHILEHYPDPLKELSLIKNIINKDAIIYIEVPGILDLHNKIEYRCDFLRFLVLAHMHNYSLGTLTNVLGLAGYSLVEGTEFVRAVFKLDPNTSSSIRNYYHRTIEYLQNQDEYRRIFYEFRLNKGELDKHKHSLDQQFTQSMESSARIKGVQENIEKIQVTINSIEDQLKKQIVREDERVRGEMESLEGKVITLRDELQLQRNIYEEKHHSQAIQIEILRSQIDHQQTLHDREMTRQRSDMQNREEELQKEVESIRARNETLEIGKTRAAHEATEAIKNIRKESLEVESWLKNQIVQVLTEKKSLEEWSRKQLALAQQERAGLIKNNAAETNNFRSQIRGLEIRIDDIQAKYDHLSGWHKVMLNSLSWKITAPIRKVKDVIFPFWKAK